MLSDEASKLHKSLDLTIYLDYLRQLFAQSTSDSDSSDSDSQVIQYEDVDPPSQGNPTPTSTPPNPPNDTSSSHSHSSSKSNFNFTPSSTNSNGDEESSPSARTTKSSASSGNSVSTSGNTTEEEEDCSDLDLTPISDLEFSNLFLDHKLWKKSPDPDQDFLTLHSDDKNEKQIVFPGCSGQSSKSKPQFREGSSDSTVKIEDCLNITGGILGDDGDDGNPPSRSQTLLADPECGDDDGGHDDNDSLSDYMNMTANSALVLDPYFKYESDCLTPTSISSAPGVLSKINIHDIRKQHKHMTKNGSKHHHHHHHHHSKKMSEHKKAKTIESMNIKRRRLYILLCKKEIGKTQRARVNNHKEMLITQRRLALACNRHFKQKAIQSQKAMKESIWRAKRHSREMQAWKQTDRIERDVRKRRETEVDEQRRIDLNMMEAKQQQRKLNFLITQAELYSHFLAKKLGVLTLDENDILNQLDEPGRSNSDTLEYNADEMKTMACRNVEDAIQSHFLQHQQFELDDSIKILQSTGLDSSEITQPYLFHGDLKHYQLKGVNWLASLFDRGMNGILADEMGLGKTIQSIAFLAHLAEKQGIWGPFLVITPISTLHNWQQEFSKFLPDFKVVPYWGNPQERTQLRQIWQLTDSQTQKTNFHAVVTSHQILVSDFKYFDQIKWQYFVLDEALAIKNGARWKSLLRFNCRNRLLLTGTSPSNQIVELWDLIHFVMPSLIESHDEEFNEWLSKGNDSESSYPGSKFLTSENEFARLQRILEPFMLRRLKKDIQHELIDKVEYLIHCPLTAPQRSRYKALKRRIRVEDLFRCSGSINSQLAQNAIINLSNLIVQFRKVCNHPSLFERRQISSPFFMPLKLNIFPKLISFINLSSSHNYFDNLQTNFSIYSPPQVHESLTHGILDEFSGNWAVYSEWSFTKFIGLSPAELNQTVHSPPLTRWRYILDAQRRQEIIYQQHQWNEKSQFVGSDGFLLNIHSPLSFPNRRLSSIIQDLLFVTPTGSVYTRLQEKITCVPETAEHRKLRSRKLKDASLIGEVKHKPKDPEFRELCLAEMPRFLTNLCPKVRNAKPSVRLSSPQLNNLFSHDALTNISTEPLPFLEIGFHPYQGWSSCSVPDKEKLIVDSGKLRVLDNLLQKLRLQGHRVLLYTHMAKMMDLLEEYLRIRKWTYFRLDSTCKASDRRDMITEFQIRSDPFVFLLSTRTVWSGINLTAADTVIFFENDLNPMVDQLAMDRAHRLGQTKQVTVYRLICKDTIEEKILQRAQKRKGIQKPIGTGEIIRSEELKPTEIVHLLVDDYELERKYSQKYGERKSLAPGDAGNSGDLRLSNSSKRKSLTFSEKAGSSKYQDTFKKPKFHDSTDSAMADMSLACDSPANGSPLQTEASIAEESGAEMTDEVFSSNDDDFLEGSDPDELGTDDYDTVDGVFVAKSYSNAESVSDFEDEFGFVVRRKFGRGSGRRGRPPLRVRTVTREYDADSPFRRGPGRPRIKPIGPANQGNRGRGPGRPPKKLENSSSSSLPLTTSQKVFGFYSCLDLEPS